MQIPTYAYALCALGLYWVVKRIVDRRKAQRLPPGPPSLAPYAAKAGPKPFQWVIFDAVKDDYGPMFSFFRGATPVIVISKAQIAWDLLQKRGEKYSSRPRLVLAHELVSGGLRGTTMPYGKSWRTYRKILNTGMNGRAATAYCDHQTLESALTLRSLLHDPDNYSYHFQLFATSVVLSIAYGRRTATMDDPMIKLHEDAVMDFQKATVSDNPVNMYPWLLYLPRFMQWFRREADVSFGKSRKLYVDMLMDVKKRMDSGTGKECIASRCLKTQESLGFSDLELAFAVTSPYSAGTDTTAGTLELGLCAMIYNPAAARKAQEELDRVVGRGRLPTFGDESSLPYVNAWLKELNRWHPVVPLAVPHCVTEDDVYEGYYIPKGATVFGNLYTMMRDPEMFPDPDTFRPERFLDTDDPKLVDFTLSFGFGRRHCPGMHIAQQSMFIVLSRVLWAFDVFPATNEAGEPIMPDMGAMKLLGITRKPGPFQFVAKPRFPEAASVIEKEALEAEKMLKAWDC